MAHIQQQEFCKSIQNKFPDFFKNKFVLDIGSLDINGNNQEYFENSNYIGVDIAYGRNVDIVSKGHELGFPDNTFDIIISTECFEHDQYYFHTIQNIYRMLKAGGLFMFTCATTGRAEHGTRRTTPEDAPLLQSDTEWSDYYKNLTETDIREILDIENDFVLFEFSTNEISNDLYFYGFKKGSYLLRDDYSFLLSDKPRQSKNFIQLFIEDENGISEENSIQLPVEQNDEVQRFEFDLNGRNSMKSLKLDPLNDSCVVEIEKLFLLLTDEERYNLIPYISANSCSHHGRIYFFEFYDPQIFFSSLDTEILNGARKLCVELKYCHIAKDAVKVCANQRMIDENMNQKIAYLKNEFESVYASKGYKMAQPLRALMKAVRRFVS